MPLSFTPIGVKQEWLGTTWTVEDEYALAAMLARVAIGQSAIVEKILQDTGCTTPDMATGGIQGARNLLMIRNGRSPAHRDGWVFQVISWITTHLQANAPDKKTMIRPPHMIHAQKGQDGLVIEYSDEDIARVVICEDKATMYPRQQFRDKVLPDFDDYETGARDNELIAGVTSILARHDIENADDIVANILWEDQRAYRVALTVAPNQTSTTAQTGLFEGYVQSVQGDIMRRRVELMPLTCLRPWMNALADKALALIDQHDV